MSSPCKSCLVAMMKDIDGKTAVDTAEIDSVDNSRRYERMGLEYDSEYIYLFYCRSYSSINKFL